MPEVNTNFVQFSGKFEIPQELDPNRYVMISGEFQIGDITQKPTQENGEFDQIYKVSPNRIVVDFGEKRLVGKVKKRSSQRLRGAIWHEYLKTEQPAEFFDDYYDEFVNKLITHLPEVTNFLAQ